MEIKRAWKRGDHETYDRLKAEQDASVADILALGPLGDSLDDLDPWWGGI